jgi:chromosome segregation ATPase
LIEAAMVFAIGFLTASLIALLTVPALSRRAERLARRRIEAQFPTSFAEIAAERDHLRAQMAVETRKIELKADAVARSKADDMAELGRRASMITRLEGDLAERVRLLTETEAQLAAVRAELEQKTQEAAETGARLLVQEEKLAEREASLAALQEEHHKLSQTADERRITVAALETTVESLRARVGELERTLEATKATLANRQSALADQETRSAVLGHKLATAEEDRALREKALVVAVRERDDLKDRLAGLGEELEEARSALSSQRAVNAALETELDRLRRDSNAAAGDLAVTLETLRAEKAALTGELETSRSERTRLQKDLKAMTRKLEVAGAAAPDAGDARLREEIQALSAEILRAAGQPSLPPSSEAPRPAKRRAAAGAAVPQTATSKL